MSDYVDPKRFQEGAEAARMKAIASFEEVLLLVPGTEMSRFRRPSSASAPGSSDPR